MKKNLFGLFVVLAICYFSAQPKAANLTVCASGCTYNNTQLQNAIDAAVAGDTILLQEGFEYVAPSVGFQLKAKACGAANDTCYITIKTGVLSNGTLSTESNFPASNIRITPSYESRLAKLKVGANNVGAIETPANTAVKYWKLQRLQFTPNSYGGDSLIRLGFSDSTNQASKSVTPSNFVLDQVILKGDPVFGQFRAISIHANNVSITNSYIYHIKSLYEGQAIWVNNTVGPLSLINNYVEGATETFLTGGDGGTVQSTTVLASPAPTTTSATLAAHTDLIVGQGITLEIAGVEKYAEIVSCGTSVAGADCTSDNITFTPALSSAPSVPGNVQYGIVTKNITVQKNYFTRPLSWQTTNIVATPTGVTANGSISGGSLAAGTYYYKVVARTLTNRATYARSTASSETSGTVASGSSGSVTISWSAVPDASEYYIYGRNSGGQNVRFSVTAPTVTFTDTGAAGTTENVPTTTGNKWFVKNTFELKQADTVLMEGNIFENSWIDGQGGPIVVFTCATQASANDSAIVRNITFRYNIVRNGAQAFQFAGRDAQLNPSGRCGGFNLTDNLIYDIGTPYGVNNAIIVVIGGTTEQAPNRNTYDFTLNHNTFHSVGNTQNSAADVQVHDGSVNNTIPNFVVTNNIFYKGTYGFATEGSGGISQGQISLAQGSGSLWDKNIVADASCGIYPTGTQCPSITSLEADTFTNTTSRDFIVKNTSAYYNAGTDGKSYGADISLITPLTNIALSGNNSSGPTNPPVSISTTTLPSGSIASAYSTDITATGGTTPYVWGVVGSLPSGLGTSLVSNALRISGQPLVAGTYNFTVNVTGSDSSTDSQDYSVTIAGLSPTLEPRPEKVDWNEGAFFRRATAPDVANDQVKVGDLWYDLANGVLKYAQATSPSLVWSNVGSTTGLTTATLSLYLGAGVSFTPAIGGEEWFAARKARNKIDAQSFTQCAVVTAVADGSSVGGTVLRAEYWTGSAWADAGCSTSITSSNTFSEGSFTSLTVGARAAGTIFRAFVSNGDGADNLTLNSIAIMFR